MFFFLFILMCLCCYISLNFLTIVFVLSFTVSVIYNTCFMTLQKYMPRPIFSSTSFASQVQNCDVTVQIL